jgi:predicted PurR-regulated permease PerM
MTIRAYAPYVVVTLALLALALLIAKLAPVLLLAFAGVVFATVIRSASTPLERRLHLNSTVAVAIVALAIALLFALFGWLFGRQLMSQTTELWSAVQEAAGKLQAHLADSPLLSSAFEQVRGAASPETMNKVAKGTLTVFGIAADMVLVVFLSIYLALDPAL